MKPIRIATLEAYVSGDARDIGDLKEKDLNMVLVMVQRIPVILVHPNFPEKEAIVKAALEGVQREKKDSFPQARGGEKWTK